MQFTCSDLAFWVALFAVAGLFVYLIISLAPWYAFGCLFVVALALAIMGAD